MLEVVTEMENIFKQNMLYDFYGELLTEHQRKIYEAAVFEDMSLSEIGNEFGISRQGVHDLIKRCDKTLRDYEDKLHLLQRFEETKKMAGRIHALSLEAKEATDLPQCMSKISEIEQLSVQLIKEL
jgi:predicted DNA-binding protein YlxM (UPF0122 family)